MRRLVRLDYRAVICLALSAMAGWLGDRIGVPLSWLLGPLLVTSIFAIADVPVVAPVMGRRLGQLIIGSSVGLNLSWPVLMSLVGWFPLMVIGAASSVIVASILAVGFARAAKLDQKTAYFAMMPGGLSEMANTGLSQGARPEPIALSQALRVGLVVCVVPPLLLLFSNDANLEAWVAAPAIGLQWLPIVLGVGLAGALALRLVRFQNPWMIGPLLAVAALTASGAVSGRMPVELVMLGQYLLGIAIGSRFKGDIVRRLARLSMISIVFTVVLTSTMAALAVFAAAATGLEFSGVMLGVAPGGFAEMVVTAQVLHTQVALVTGFHVVRSLMINGLALSIFQLLERARFFPGADRFWRRMIPD